MRGVVEERARAPAPGVDEDVERGCVGHGGVRQDARPFAPRTAAPDADIVVTDQPSSGKAWVHAASTS